MTDLEKAVARLRQWHDGSAPDVTYCAGNTRFAKDVTQLLAAHTEATELTYDQLAAAVAALRTNETARRHWYLFNGADADYVQNGVFSRFIREVHAALFPSPPGKEPKT